MKKRVLVMSFSDLGRDPRVDRQIRFLSEDYEVVTAGFGRSSDETLEFHPIAWKPEPFAASILRRTRNLPGVAVRRYEHMHWTMPIHRASREALAGVDVDLVLVNDVPGLPVAFEVARGGPVILDSHEHAPTEYGERRTWRLLGGPYVEWLLKTYGPRLAAMTAVSRGIADAYEAQFGFKVDVLTNAPFKADLEPTPVGNPLRLIHHGVGAERRKLEFLIEAVEPLGDMVRLDLMLAPGSVPYIQRLEKMAAALDHVRILPPVPYPEIIPTVNTYDVGVHLIPPGTTHDYYALPNKVFEFIQGRVALAVSPSPDMQAIVEQYALGVVASAPTPEAFREALAGLDPERVAAFKQASHRAADILNAEHNRDALVRMVGDALTRHGSSTTTHG